LIDKTLRKDKRKMAISFMQTYLEQDASFMATQLQQDHYALSSGARTAHEGIEAPQPIGLSYLDRPAVQGFAGAVEDGSERTRCPFAERDGIAPFRLGTGGLSLPVRGEGR
jgi:hypothetical protein